MLLYPYNTTTSIFKSNSALRRPPTTCRFFCSSLRLSLNSSQRAARLPRLTLYTGTDCSLCDVAKEVLEQVKQEQPFELSLYNIRDDSLPDIKKWRRAYQYDIRVLHLEGKEIARHRLDKSRLLQQLRKESRELEL